MTGRLRLTGGTLARRLIDVPEAAERGALRPTSDKVREALFSILGSRYDFDSTRIADVCCGSGALGFEALSRGAASCTFVDLDRKTTSVVSTNATGLGVVAQCTFVTDSVMRWLPRATASFNMIFFDPPYAMSLDHQLRRGLRDALVDGGVLVVERAAKSVDAPFEGLSVVDERRYGDTRLVLLQRLEQQ
jgi:16S rRNA (guanine966-N2)-methyltransferase